MDPSFELTDLLNIIGDFPEVSLSSEDVKTLDELFHLSDQVISTPPQRVIRQPRRRRSPTVSPPSSSSACYFPALDPLINNPLYDQLTAALVQDSPTIPASTPFLVTSLGLSEAVQQTVPLSTQVALLQLRFQNLGAEHHEKTADLQGFYQLQSSRIEAQRFQELQQMHFTPWVHPSINSYYDKQHLALVQRVEKSVQVLESHTPHHTIITTHIPVLPQPKKFVEPAKKKSCSLSVTAVCIMERWYERNANHPYPSYDTAEVMARAGGITVEQVKKWFANKRMRARNTKPLSEIARRRRKREDDSAIFCESKRVRDC